MKRFSDKVDASGDCWEWTAAKRRGYGAFWLNGRHVPAHRVAWMLKHGELPADDMQVCHKCDNPSCVNPDHLFLGTAADNLADMHRKGRGRGMFAANENHPKCVLSDKDVQKIIAATECGETQRSVARRYGINQATVSRIVNGHRRGG